MMDNEQERNEHFKGFAELLLEDLKECGAIPKFLNAYYAEQARTIIAQRAYDLVDHACTNITGSMINWHIEDRVHAIPDLTEWPTPPQP